MKKYALITTFYCKDCICPTKTDLQSRFNYDGDIDDLFINFSNNFDPWHYENIPVNTTGRKDLIYGKIFLLKKFIEENILGKYEYVSHIDYSDTKFAKSFLSMMESFESTNQDFIISTEKICWPYIDAVRKWVNYELQEREFEYINSGALISRTEVLLNYLNKLSKICLNSKIDFWDDQGVWQYYNLNIEKLNSDKNCNYFFSTALLDNTYYSIQDKTITTKFGTQPFLIHDNSSFSLNLREKIDYNLYKIPRP